MFQSTKHKGIMPLIICGIFILNLFAETAISARNSGLPLWPRKVSAFSLTKNKGVFMSQTNLDGKQLTINIGEVLDDMHSMSQIFYTIFKSQLWLAEQDMNNDSTAIAALSDRLDSNIQKLDNIFSQIRKTEFEEIES